MAKPQKLKDMNNVGLDEGDESGEEEKAQIDVA